MCRRLNVCYQNAHCGRGDRAVVGNAAGKGRDSATAPDHYPVHRRDRAHVDDVADELIDLFVDHNSGAPRRDCAALGIDDVADKGLNGLNCNARGAGAAAEITPLLLMPPVNVETGPPDGVMPTKIPLPPTSIVALLLIPPPNVETLVTVIPAPLLPFVIVPELLMPPTMVAPFTRIPLFEEKPTTPLLVRPPTSVASLLIRMPVAVALTVPVLMTLPLTLTLRSRNSDGRKGAVRDDRVARSSRNVKSLKERRAARCRQPAAPLPNSTPSSSRNLLRSI